MGIIDSIKSIFSSNISLDVSKVNSIVYPYALKGGKIKVNCKLNVPENFSCVLGYNGKALDCFSSGEFFLAPATLPECCKKLKIHKTDKNNKTKKDFKADVYYISHQTQKMEWRTFEKAELGQKLSGIFSVGAVGKLEYVVSNAPKLIENLLTEFAYIKNGEAEKILKIWISESVVKTLNKYNFALSEFMSDNPVIVENVKTGVSQILFKFGITVKEFEIDEFLLPRKYQKEYNSNKKKKAKEQDNKDKKSKIKVEELAEQTEVQQMEEAKEPNLEAKDFAYTPFGDFVIEEVESTCEKVEAKEVEQQEQPQQEDEQEDVLEDYEEVEFVDLDIDKLIQSDKNKVRCINCGAENDKKETNCTSCGNKL